MKYIITEKRLNKLLDKLSTQRHGVSNEDNPVKINESKIDNKIFLFLDSYLDDYTPEESSTLIIYGKGNKNQIAYDKNERILFIRDSLQDLIKNMFNLSTTGTNKVFKNYFESKGYKVKRFV
jgi:hypothetical protein